MPSEPPPLCARGSIMARAHVLSEELITVDVDHFEAMNEMAEEVAIQMAEVAEMAEMAEMAQERGLEDFESEEYHDPGNGH